MNKSYQQSIQSLREHLLSLFDSPIPIHCEEPACPIYTLSQMTPRKRAAWIHALDRSDLEYLASYHHVCLKTCIAAKLDRDFYAACQKAAVSKLSKRQKASHT